MLKLCNFSNYPGDLERVNHNPKDLEEFLSLHGLDGVELMLCQAWDSQIIPSSLIKGIHLREWPIWLDFWQGNQGALLEYFGSREKISEYYGGQTKEVLVQGYQEQIREAEKTGAEYVVFHVSHTQVKHLLDQKFTCSDEEVVEATIELLNKIFLNFESQITLLLENLWMRGLTFLKPQLAQRLLDEINYPYKGFMLDTGHLLNTNPFLTSQQEGIEYILETIRNLGPLKEYIQGIHLQKSLSGKYVLQNSSREVKPEELMEHIFKLDEHQPFADPQIRKVVEMVQPRYLIHEFITRSKAEWSSFLTTQNKALGL